MGVPGTFDFIDINQIIKSFSSGKKKWKKEGKNYFVTVFIKMSQKMGIDAQMMYRRFM